MHPRITQRHPATSGIQSHIRAGGRINTTDLEVPGFFQQQWDKRHYKAATQILFVLHVVHLLYDFLPKGGA